MRAKYVVGNVISVDGLKITALMRENTNMLSYFYNGETYRGVSIGEYVGIIRGPYKIIGKVEKEYLEDKTKEFCNQIYEINRFQRKIELSIIGCFFNTKFEYGIKCFPMIFNEVVLLNDSEIHTVILGENAISEYRIPFGKSVQEQIEVELPWNRVFNTHIGIFGNTGSGKSNTLAKMYTELFRKNNDSLFLDGKSRFLFLDFNGEYTGQNTLSPDKEVIRLTTKNDNGDKLVISPENIWDIESLSILFSATEKTQRPFLQSVIKYFVNPGNHDVSTQEIICGISSGFWNVFKGNNHKESLRLLNDIYRTIGLNTDDQGMFTDNRGINHSVPWCKYLWHTAQGSYYLNGDYINGKTDAEIANKRNELDDVLSLEEIIQKISALSFTNKLKIIVNLQLIYGLRCNHVQFEHINPLLLRIESRSKFIDKIIHVAEEDGEDTVSVVSLKNCNQDAKKMIPLLLAKHEYSKHKSHSVDDEHIEHTFHLVIDEAHNILSEQSKREEETWKDYRLEVFEEIIKEGRKFGFYLTISSQRPYDISATIISQLHNYLLHRLVNELDLKMIGNTINSLDSISKQRIPNLAPGQCIVTGTSFDLPLLIQVDRLSDNEVPNSDNADLVNLWTIDDI
mgnify:CR=1 FL=1